MPSSYTSRARFTLQATGENANTWGVILNEGAFELIDFAINGFVTKSASATLTTALGATDEARGAVILYTGASPGTITIPSVEKTYIVRAATAACTITNGSGSVTIAAGSSAQVFTDGSSVWTVLATDFGGQRLRNLGAPTANTDAATKKYADDLAFTANAGILPGQTGNDGLFLSTDGTTAQWASPFPVYDSGKYLRSTGSGTEWVALPDLTTSTNTWTQAQTFSSNVSVGGNATVTGTLSVTGAATVTTLTASTDVILPSTAPTNVRSAGYRGVPPVTLSSSRDLALTDNGQRLIRSTSGAATLTIQPQSSIAYPDGFSCVIRVIAGTVPVARGSGVTLRAAASSTNGNVTVPLWGQVTLTKDDTDVWVIAGAGI